MKISLKKAHALQLEIKAAIQKIPLTHSIDINQYQEPVTRITEARDTLYLNLQEREKLQEAVTFIRKAINRVNVTAGISDILNDVAHIDATITSLQSAISANPRLSSDEITGRLEKIKNSDNVMYGRDIVNTSCLTADEINEANSRLQSLRKEKKKFQETLLTLNYNFEIELSEKIVDDLADFL